MSAQFNNIAIIGRQDDARVAEAVRELATHLAAKGVRLLAANKLLKDVPITLIDEPELCAAADLVIAVGGDGTMLYASRLARDCGTPILGINRGRLGFLADVTPDEMLASVDQVLAGKYAKDTRLLLEACLIRKSGRKKIAFALNDVVMQRRGTGRMVDFATHVDGQYVNTHSGDGLIVATPTGSTAYSLSCGGPIIEPQLSAVVIVPVCPHTLTDRPIVVPAEAAVQVTLLERDDTKAEITVDGFSMGSIHPTDKLIISAYDKRVTLIHPPDYDFYGILRSKLFWGRDNRRRDVREG